MQTALTATESGAAQFQISLNPLPLAAPAPAPVVVELAQISPPYCPPVDELAVNAPKSANGSGFAAAAVVVAVAAEGGAAGVGLPHADAAEEAHGSVDAAFWLPRPTKGTGGGIAPPLPPPPPPIIIDVEWEMLPPKPALKGADANPPKSLVVLELRGSAPDPPPVPPLAPNESEAKSSSRLPNPPPGEADPFKREEGGGCCCCCGVALLTMGGAALKSDMMSAFGSRFGCCGAAVGAGDGAWAVRGIAALVVRVGAGAGAAAAGASKSRSNRDCSAGRAAAVEPVVEVDLRDEVAVAAEGPDERRSSEEEAVVAALRARGAGACEAPSSSAR